MLIKSDFHNHTSRSYCASKDAVVGPMIKELEGRGFESIGFSDHYYDNQPMAKWLEEIRKEISITKTSMDVFVGIEVDMISPGCLLAAQEQLKDYDYIMVACPHYQNKRISFPISTDYEVIAQNAYDYMLSAASLNYINVIVHPFDARGIIHKKEDFDIREMMRRLTDVEYQRIIELLLKNKIAVELTERLRQEDYFTALYPFLKQCKDNGVLFSFGSDAHAMNHLGSVREAAESIEQLGITTDMIWKP